MQWLIISQRSKLHGSLEGARGVRGWGLVDDMGRFALDVTEKLIIITVHTGT